jgi:hypothetical protein
VQPGDILVGKITPKGESPMTPEEKLLRAIFGEKASTCATPPCACRRDLRHGRRSARLQSHGVEKDERAMAIEREEIERLAKDRDDEQAILDRNVYSRLCRHAVGKEAIAGPKGFKKGRPSSTATAGRISAFAVVAVRRREREAAGRARSAARPVRRLQEGARAALHGQGREGAARRRDASRAS